jgi:hypothetical protein
MCSGHGHEKVWLSASLGHPWTPIDGRLGSLSLSDGVHHDSVTNGCKKSCKLHMIHTANTSLLECRRKSRESPIRHHHSASDVPLVARAILSLGRILLQELKHFLCGAPGLLVPGGTNGELTKEHHIKKYLDSPESVSMDN